MTKNSLIELKDLRKQIEEKIEELRLEQILNALPDNKIMTDKHAVSYLQKQTGLDEGTIVNSLNKLIEERR
ncbi:MAG: hypothetical protein ACM3VV_03870 [Deltaproteobacteria bacterium]